MTKQNSISEATDKVRAEYDRAYQVANTLLNAVLTNLAPLTEGREEKDPMRYVLAEFLLENGSSDGSALEVLRWWKAHELVAARDTKAVLARAKK